MAKLIASRKGIPRISDLAGGTNSSLKSSTLKHADLGDDASSSASIKRDEPLPRPETVTSNVSEDVEGHLQDVISEMEAMKVREESTTVSIRERRDDRKLLMERVAKVYEEREEKLKQQVEALDKRHEAERLSVGVELATALARSREAEETMKDLARLRRMRELEMAAIQEKQKMYREVQKEKASGLFAKVHAIEDAIYRSDLFRDAERLEIEKMYEQGRLTFLPETPSIDFAAIGGVKIHAGRLHRKQKEKKGKAEDDSLADRRSALRAAAESTSGGSYSVLSDILARRAVKREKRRYSHHESVRQLNQHRWTVVSAEEALTRIRSIHARVSGTCAKPASPSYQQNSTNLTNIEHYSTTVNSNTDPKTTNGTAPDGSNFDPPGFLPQINKSTDVVSAKSPHASKRIGDHVVSSNVRHDSLPSIAVPREEVNVSPHIRLLFRDVHSPRKGDCHASPKPRMASSRSPLKPRVTIISSKDKNKDETLNGPDPISDTPTSQVAQPLQKREAGCLVGKLPLSQISKFVPDADRLWTFVSHADVSGGDDVDESNLNLSVEELAAEPSFETRVQNLSRRLGVDEETMAAYKAQLQFTRSLLRSLRPPDVSDAPLGSMVRRSGPTGKVTGSTPKGASSISTFGRKRMGASVSMAELSAHRFAREIVLRLVESVVSAIPGSSKPAADALDRETVEASLDAWQENFKQIESHIRNFAIENTIDAEFEDTLGEIVEEITKEVVEETIDLRKASRRHVSEMLANVLHSASGDSIPIHATSSILAEVQKQRDARGLDYKHTSLLMSATEAQDLLLAAQEAAKQEDAGSIPRGAVVRPEFQDDDLGLFDPRIKKDDGKKKKKKKTKNARERDSLTEQLIDSIQFDDAALVLEPLTVRMTKPSQKAPEKVYWKNIEYEEMNSPGTIKNVTCITCSPNGRYFAVGTLKSGVFVIDVRPDTPFLHSKYVADSKEKGGPLHLAFSWDGLRLSVVYGSGGVRVISLAERAVELGDTRKAERQRSKEGDEGRLFARDKFKPLDPACVTALSPFHFVRRELFSSLEFEELLKKNFQEEILDEGDGDEEDWVKWEEKRIKQEKKDMMMGAKERAMLSSFHSSMTFLCTQPGVVLALAGGDLVKCNMPSSIKCIFQPTVKKSQSELMDPPENVWVGPNTLCRFRTCEMFRAHNTRVIFIGFGQDASVMISVDQCGHIYLWQYDEDSFSGFGWFSPRHRIRIELVRHVYECISEEDVVFNTSPFAEDTHTVVPSDEPTNNDEEEELLLEKKPKRRFGRKKKDDSELPKSSEQVAKLLSKMDVNPHPVFTASLSDGGELQLYAEGRDPIDDIDGEFPVEAFEEGLSRQESKPVNKDGQSPKSARKTRLEEEDPDIFDGHLLEYGPVPVDPPSPSSVASLPWNHRPIRRYVKARYEARRSLCRIASVAQASSGRHLVMVLLVSEVFHVPSHGEVVLFDIAKRRLVPPRILLPTSTRPPVVQVGPLIDACGSDAVYVLLDDAVEIFSLASGVHLKTVDVNVAAGGKGNPFLCLAKDHGVLAVGPSSRGVQWLRIADNNDLLSRQRMSERRAWVGTTRTDAIPVEHRVRSHVFFCGHMDGAAQRTLNPYANVRKYASAIVMDIVELAATKLFENRDSDGDDVDDDVDYVNGHGKSNIRLDEGLINNGGNGAVQGAIDLPAPGSNPDGKENPGKKKSKMNKNSGSGAGIGGSGPGGGDDGGAGGGDDGGGGGDGDGVGEDKKSNKKKKKDAIDGDKVKKEGKKKKSSDVDNGSGEKASAEEREKGKKEKKEKKDKKDKEKKEKKEKKDKT